jgi:hypothetical protein
MTPRFVILANPENRRVALFQAALAQEGLEAAKVISWLDFLSTSTLEVTQPSFFRIDSFGENFEVERRFLALGGYPRALHLPERYGQVIAPAQSHTGFRHTLERLDAALSEAPHVRPLNLPTEIDELFDKRRTSKRFASLGIPVPEVMTEPPTHSESLLDRCRGLGWPEAFVKLPSGSSASCLAHVSFDSRGVLVRTSLEWDAPRWFNTLKVRHLRKAHDIDRALNFILSQGAHVERGIPKAQLDGQFCDVRVLCIAHEPRFTVVRQNDLPITNLHLGGRRGDLQALKRRVAAHDWHRAMESCRAVARCYRSLHVGIDLMFEADFVGHRIIEVNAFGDLLPHLELDGRSVWQHEIRAVLETPCYASSLFVGAQ